MRAFAVMLAALVGCAGPDMLPRPAGGYQALRVLQPMRIPGVLGTFELGAGTVLVADRVGSAAAPIYCGTVIFRDLMPIPTATCAAYADGLLTLNAEKLVSARPFPVPPGSVEEIRLP